MSSLLDLETGSVLRVYKPYNWTSFDVTKKIQRLIIRKIHREIKGPEAKKKKVKVGHAGTLDPLATGLLIVCVGKETKNIEKYMGWTKTYTGQFRLGATTPSFDKETAEDQTFSIEGITVDAIADAAQQLTGALDQIPPIFSAIKKDGKRAYVSAREGVEIKMESRKVFVESFRITEIELPLVGFEIVCSKGTYIRSLARDFGKLLNNGAYLESLCRTKIGEFSLEQATTLDELAESFGERMIFKEN
ncbi:MAG: tRNA pseudouridine(55) synthase TruB [Bacteroidia bacterium]|nr:tRNA pseudouridine(55) synthase TruB [Bacteroidia bacterium]